MADDQQQELKEYVITKILEDGTQNPEKSSEHYTGKAQVQYPNGDTYEGMFNDGVREGQGTMIYGESGNKYEGEWKNDVKEGNGIYYCKNGKRVRGEWKNDTNKDCILF